VDDDVSTRVGIATILGSEASIEVVGEAADGAEACRRAKDLRPAVVVMDIQLPVMDGIEATRRLTSTGEDAPRVVVLTTFALDRYAYRSIEAGASGFLLKRAPAEELVQTVLTVADGTALPAPTHTTALISRFAPAAHTTDTFTPPLTEREVEVLVLIAGGSSNDEICGELGVSLETVRTHIKHIYTKCGARDRAHAVIAAYESGLVGPHPQG
jgi:DNA-binding NarL/FixJ family response regulator